ncbi:hypothetical protein GCM10020229_55100 [Kitasatospora albolonga]
MRSVLRVSRLRSFWRTSELTAIAASPAGRISAARSMHRPSAQAPTYAVARCATVPWAGTP